MGQGMVQFGIQHPLGQVTRPFIEGRAINLRLATCSPPASSATSSSLRCRRGCWPGWQGRATVTHLRLWSRRSGWRGVPSRRGSARSLRCESPPQNCCLWTSRQLVAGLWGDGSGLAATRPLLRQDWLPASMMAVRRCCGAALDGSLVPSKGRPGVSRAYKFGR